MYGECCCCGSPTVNLTLINVSVRECIENDSARIARLRFSKPKTHKSSIKQQPTPEPDKRLASSAAAVDYAHAPGRPYLVLRIARLCHLQLWQIIFLLRDAWPAFKDRTSMLSETSRPSIRNCGHDLRCAQASLGPCMDVVMF